ncbi:MAG: hypothetical protein RSC49_02170 [Clostridium sp.]
MVAKKKEAKIESKKKGEAVDTDKEAKRKARMEAIKNRPAGQRPNSKQIDIIEVGTGKVLSFGYAVRKFGVLVTSVLLDAKGNPVGISSAVVPGSKVKSKKEHGYLQPGVAGEGKKKKGEEEEESDDQD